MTIYNEAIKPDEKHRIDHVQRIAGFAFSTLSSEKAASWPDEAHSQIVSETEKGGESIDIPAEVHEMSLWWTFTLGTKLIYKKKGQQSFGVRLKDTNWCKGVCE